MDARYTVTDVRYTARYVRYSQRCEVDSHGC